MSDLQETARRITQEAMAEKSSDQLKFLLALHDEYFPPGPKGSAYRRDGGIRYQLKDIVFQMTCDLLKGDEMFDEISQLLEQADYLPVAYQHTLVLEFALRERCNSHRNEGTPG